MSEQIEYIEPTQEHVGQMVEVRDNNCGTWRSAELVAIIDDGYKFVARLPGHLSGLCWKQARIPRPLTYAERQAKCGLKVGDRVKFVRSWDDGELGTSVRYYNAIDKYVGAIGRVVDMCSQGIKVAVNVAEWYLPYFVLEKVEDRQATIDNVGREVYIVPDYGNTFIFEAFYGVPGNPWRAVVRSGDKRFVYELSNLRVKE